MGESAMSAYSSVARSPLSMRRLMMSVGRGSCPCARHNSQLRPPLWPLCQVSTPHDAAAMPDLTLRHGQMLCYSFSSAAMHLQQHG